MINMINNDYIICKWTLNP